jgi:hypothetical protein
MVWMVLSVILLIVGIGIIIGVIIARDLRLGTHASVGWADYIVASAVAMSIYACKYTRRINICIWGTRILSVCPFEKFTFPPLDGRFTAACRKRRAVVRSLEKLH